MKRLLFSGLLGACMLMGIAGCGPQENGMTHEAIYANLDDKVKTALERSNDPKDIDKEFKKRLTAIQKAADKLLLLKEIRLLSLISSGQQLCLKNINVSWLFGQKIL